MDDDYADQLDLAEAARWLDETAVWECRTCGTTRNLHSAYECKPCHSSREHEQETR